MRLRLLIAFLLLVLSATWCAAPGTADASALAVWTRPVAGRVERRFQAPMTRFGRGHLGVDLAARPGTSVRAAGAGTVVFAGLVATTLHVVIRHPGGLRTSYSFLASIRVRTGAAVARGAVLGTTGGSGEGHSGAVLHFGLRIGDTYVDPMTLFEPPDLAAVVHLAPIADGRSGRPDLDAERASLTSGLAVPARPAISVPDAVGAAVADPTRPAQLVSSGRRTANGFPIFPR